MSYTAKTNWQGNDPVTESDINRWEVGIEEAHNDASVTTKGRVQLSNATDSNSEVLAATPKAVKTVADQIGVLLDKTDDLKTIKTNKDANGIYTIVTYRRKSDNSLYATSVLSGGSSPSYTTRTITYYEQNGTIVRKTVTFTLSYDTDGVLISEV
ncbi:hypothetical protein ASF99_04725 [Exiguobacterium sp. Leaf187]|uniref:phage tail protein n=1 Tax=Exiguobacterium sp. Leaf187 TaxID=1736294 RepID=UPI0006F606CD|nr:phage tail protein [Exiguobacterium sp. Leaf187]KQS19193.1 hypothetical protein ASF99_04725 [Exiguobacterium sp. Leaf187]